MESAFWNKVLLPHYFQIIDKIVDIFKEKEQQQHQLYLPWR